MTVRSSGNGNKGRRYGLIGHPLGHSLSPFIHQKIMEAAGIEGSYELFDVRPESLDQMLPRIMRHLDGFNCTIPHKEKIIPSLHALDVSAEQYGAVNTVHQGIGHNTDGAGFRACDVEMKGKRVLLLGAGGVSRMMGFEAARAGAESIRIFARGYEKARRLAEDITERTDVDAGSIESLEQAGRTDVVLNGTPLGMWPQVRDLPVPAEFAASSGILFDSIYNPAATRMLLCAQSGGAVAKGGLPMLFGQALAAQRIWNPEVEWEKPEIRRRLAAIPPMLAREQGQRHDIKYVFTGFMGSGKSVIGRKVADMLDLDFIDLDDRIRSYAGKSIPKIFEEDGETSFRIMEAELLRTSLSEKGSAVIATGGGALLQPDAMLAVEQTRSLVVFLDTSLENIRSRIGRFSGRPLLDRSTWDKSVELYGNRKPEYIARADLIMDNNGPEDTDQVAERVITALGYGEEPAIDW